MATSGDGAEPSRSLTYIDLLVTMLMRHERNLNRLIERLEEISDLLDNVAQTLVAEKRRKRNLEMLYI